MKGFYNLLDTIKTELNASPFVNTTTYGDITRIDLNKATIFPLSHFIVNNITYGENSLTYSISLLCMDIVDESKEDVTDIFVGNNNEHDVFNTQMNVIVRLLDKLNTGALHDTLYQLNGDPSIEPFIDRFDNRLAGWTVTLDVEVINDMTC